VNETIVIQPAAARDLAEQADYLAERSLDAAMRYSHAVAETFRHLAAMPTLGTVREFHNPALSGVRMWRIRGFRNYLIFYRAIPDGIEVLRVLHAARDINAILDSP
jgi:toxin ParE1/3/4